MVKQNTSTHNIFRDMFHTTSNIIFPIQTQTIENSPSEEKEEKEEEHEVSTGIQSLPL